jgi:cytochrome P450
MVHAIVHSDLPPEEKTLEHVSQEVATVTGAGFETTASAMRLILFHVFSNTEILERLRAELGSVSTTTANAVPLKTLEQLPYLTAVLTEGLRLSPAIATRATRVHDKDLVYENWCIPAGTSVGMTTYLMHMDEKLYAEPLRFKPERWLGDDAGASGAATFAPFGRGTRMCLGMQ